jgi:cytochrome c553
MIARAPVILATLAVCAIATSALAADVAAGLAKAKEVCQACHALDGNSTIADYPKLGGQYPDYLAKALRDYQSGARKNAIMGPFAGMLTAKDIENVAAYYGSQPPAITTKY